jgi:hypothetical protein
MFWIATVSATLLVAACKTSDRPAGSSPSAKAPDPVAKPASAAPRSADPAMPADPAARSAAAPRAIDPDLEVKGIAMMQRLADVFVADAKDCDKLAADIKAFVAQNRPLLSQLAAMEQQETDQQRDDFSRRNREVEVAIAQKMQSGMALCAANPAVLAAMKEFPAE